MQLAAMAILATGMWPWFAAWRANRGWSLEHAIFWGMAAWASWGVAAIRPGEAADFVSLALTGAAGIAVFGARRPHVAAWNFVVLGLVGVMLLPLVENWVLGARSLDGLRQFFLIATLALVMSNYLPTRFWPAATLLGISSGIVAAHRLRADSVDPIHAEIARLAVLMSPWFAWRFARRAANDSLEARWLDFRDRYGLVWAQRVREQFNHSAQNAGWATYLTWQTLTIDEQDAAREAEMRRSLSGLLQRFEARDDAREPIADSLGDSGE
ncbi:MAG: hypothetical protein K2X38_11190 [Gemmataceae bacterium]|nr:hypothetical protein [Gemmataceae bacterium]